MTNILNIILAALSKGISDIFPNIDIFVEDIPEKLPSKCFMIGFAGNVSAVRELTSRQKIYGKIDIAMYMQKYSPDQNKEFNACFAYFALFIRHISHEGVNIAIQNHQRNIVDGVLHILCDFSTFIFAVDESPTITEIESEEIYGGS